MRRCVTAVVCLLILAGCEISHVNPDQTVVISGRALTATGAPLSDVQVHLFKEVDFGEFVFGATAALGSLGTVCLLPSAPAICHKGFEATTSADGSYRFTIKGSDTQGMIRELSTLDLVFADPKSASSPSTATLRFKAKTTSVQLPTARLWDSGLRVAEGRSTIDLSWHALKGATYAVQLIDRAQGISLWMQPASGASAHVDARVLEDATADAAVTARVSLGNDVNAVYLSRRGPVRPVSGAPPSRHAACSALTGTTHLVAAKQITCGATNGDLTTPSRLTATTGGAVTGVVVTLPQARPIALIVARGLTGSVLVEVSVNGTAWRRVSASSAATVAVQPAGRPQARFVRVRSVNGLDESTLTEVSVW